MKVAYTFLIILIIITCSLFPSQAADIYFYLDYNVITFSSFHQLLQSAYTNIFDIHIEYNPLIPVYISWNNPRSMELLKGKMDEQQIHFFSLNQKIIDNKRKNEWYYSIQSEMTKKIFKALVEKQDIRSYPPLKENIRILNLNELNNILNTISDQKLTRNLRFKIDLSLLLFDKYQQFIDSLIKHGHTYHFYIYSEKDFPIPQNEISHLVDLIYSLKTQKKLKSSELNIFNLSYLLFTIKLFSSSDEILLNLFPLTAHIPKYYQLSSMEYKFNKSTYITIYDNKNLITFDTKGILKKWFLLENGISLINFDSLLERIYIQEPHEQYQYLDVNNTDYLKFNNGLSFQHHYTKNISTEKNIILENNKLLVSYKIRNQLKNKVNCILEVENKFFPDLNNNLMTLKNNFAFYNNKSRDCKQAYDISYNSIINLNTGYGIRWNFLSPENGVEFYKGFYHYTNKTYFKFSLYPYEQTVITLQYDPICVSQDICAQFLNKVNIGSNQYWGDYSIK